MLVDSLPQNNWCHGSGLAHAPVLGQVREARTGKKQNKVVTRHFMVCTKGNNQWTKECNKHMLCYKSKAIMTKNSTTAIAGQQHIHFQFQ